MFCSCWRKKINVVPKKNFVCDCYLDFSLKWQLQKTDWENIYDEVTEIMNEATFILVSKKLSFVVKKVFLVIYAQMIGK